MAQEPDVIRREIEETRCSLTDKIETLEGQVKETVQNAREAVQDTICTVKETVQETVDTVKRTFDPRYQVDRHPWAMVGGSMIAGVVVGALLPSRRQLGSWNRQLQASLNHEVAARHVVHPTPPAARFSPHEPAVSSKPGFFARLAHQFDDEIEKAKGVAVGVVAGLVRDWIKEALPPKLGPRVDEVIDSATTKLGGEPIRGSVLSDAC